MSVINTPATLETQSSGIPHNAIGTGFSHLVSDTNQRGKVQ